jgi:hypothetical protein
VLGKHPRGGGEDFVSFHGADTIREYDGMQVVTCLHIRSYY